MSDFYLPEGWILVRYDDVYLSASNGTGGSQNKEGRGIPVSRIETIANETIDYQRIGFLSKYDESKVEKHKLAFGDILFSHINSPIHLGKTAIYNDKRTLYHGINLLRIIVDRKLISPKIFNWHCKYTRGLGEFALRAQHAVNQSSLNQKKLGEFEIPLFPLAEQKVIADKLDTLLAQVEATKARLERIPEILKAFRQSVLAAAVSGRLNSSDSIYRSIEVKENWAHKVEGRTHWKEHIFSDVIKIIGGSQPPKSEFLNENRDGYVRLIQIRDYKSDAHKVYIPLEKAKRFVSKEDIMIGRYGPPIFQILRGLEGAYNVALMKAEPNAENLDREYLYWYLQNYKLFNYIDAGSDRTAGQTGVNKKYLESYPILVPPLDEQTEIVRRVEELFAFAKAIEQKANAALERVNNLTQSILAKAFRGELTANWRLENPDLISGDNSAEALLEKIKAEREAMAATKKRRAG